MRSHSRLATLVIAFVFASAPSLGAQLHGNFTSLRSGTVSAAGARVVRIDARAGTLRVEGRPNPTQVRANGTARASTRALLDQVRLTVERRADVVYVTVDLPEIRGDWEDEDHASLDLVVEVPETLPLEVEDSSGDLEIRGVGPLDLVDHSGEATIEKVGGRLRVRDGSGELRIRDVGGDVELEDGSGGIHLRTIRGSVTVERDGSGELEAEDVIGSVRIESKGSGSVEVERVGGDFTVGHKGTGSIEYRDVRGRVSVPDRERRRWRRF